MYTGNKLMRLFYQSFYFYFLPFVCIIANFAAPRCDLVMRLSTTETVERNNFKPSYETRCDEHFPSTFISHLLDYSLFKYPSQ